MTWTELGDTNQDGVPDLYPACSGQVGSFVLIVTTSCTWVDPNGLLISSVDSSRPDFSPGPRKSCPNSSQVPGQVENPDSGSGQCLKPRPMFALGEVDFWSGPPFWIGEHRSWWAQRPLNNFKRFVGWESSTDSHVLPDPHNSKYSWDTWTCCEGKTSLFQESARCDWTTRFSVVDFLCLIAINYWLLSVSASALLFSLVFQLMAFFLFLKPGLY